jgi:hypothetical protein
MMRSVSTGIFLDLSDLWNKKMTVPLRKKVKESQIAWP